MSTTINEIFRENHDQYLALYGDSIPFEHKKAMNAMIKCKTPANGFALYQCEDCGTHHWIFRSCGNRHCAGCQYHKTAEWLKKQQARQLPGPHFMMTFTVPAQIRDFIRTHQRKIYPVLFAASSGAIKTLAADKRYMGTNRPGFFGVLHTWGRQLQYHPHIHYVVVGGAVSKSGETWQSTSSDFYLPIKALSKLFRGKFKAAIQAAGLLQLVGPEVWEMDWNVNCKPAGDGQAIQKYLAPYVFKVAISNARIAAYHNGKVTIKYKKVNSKRIRTTTFTVIEFMRRFLQHVLPSGFMKIRYYGFLHPSFKTPLTQIRTLIEKSSSVTLTAHVSDVEKEKTATQTCPDCGGSLRFICLVSPDGFEMIPSG